MLCAIILQDASEFFFHLIEILLTLCFHQNFDARFVFVIAPAKQVVHTHDGFQVIQNLIPRQKFANHGANHRCAAHAAANEHFEANLARFIFKELQAHIVPSNGGAIFQCARDGNFEFAWQEGKLRVQGAPLAHDFAIRAGINDFIGCDASQAIGGDVANAITTGLNAMHVHAGQQVHHIGGFF